ncbi:MAG: hypothetical protein ACRETB_11730 [Steroidobacteraceae bacterium]
MFERAGSLAQCAAGPGPLAGLDIPDSMAVTRQLIRMRMREVRAQVRAEAQLRLRREECDDTRGVRRAAASVASAFAMGGQSGTDSRTEPRQRGAGTP